MASLGLGGLLATTLLTGATICLTSGCSTIGYYAQSATGHLNLVQAARPVPQWLADNETAPRLKARLELSQRIRDFAVAELGEPDNASYRRYADLKRGAAVWNVVAAPELSLELKTWCFAVVGCVAYRGYYDRAEAEAFAADLLAREKLDVHVYPVPAYSTLGKLPAADWLADPLLNTFIDYPEGELARLIFHELAHQVAYAKGDTVFNESFATSVERIGGMRWLNEHASQAARDEYQRFDERRRQFRALTAKYRDLLAAAYKSRETETQKRADKAALMAQMRAEYETLKATAWGGFSGYDGWFTRANNASFGVLAAYTELVPAFEALFEREGRDFKRFYAEVKRLAALPKAERRAALGVSAADPGD